MNTNFKEISPDDLYVDGEDILYKVVGVCHQPTVFLENVVTGERKVVAENSLESNSYVEVGELGSMDVVEALKKLLPHINIK